VLKATGNVLMLYLYLTSNFVITGRSRWWQRWKQCVWCCSVRLVQASCWWDDHRQSWIWTQGEVQVLIFWLRNIVF